MGWAKYQRTVERNRVRNNLTRFHRRGEVGIQFIMELVADDLILLGNFSLLFVTTF